MRFLTHLGRGLLVPAIVVGLLVGDDAGADWPMARHDPQRTGAAAGTSDIGAPAPYWRYYLGGRVTEAGLLPADVDGDGAVEFLLLAGGVLLLKDRTDTLLWSSPALDLTHIVGRADLDGTGGAEIVVRSSDRVFVLDSGTGAVRWAEPVGEMGTIGAVRMGDVDGDALPDLVIAECGCCTVVGSNPGMVYSFAGSLTAPTLLWELPTAECGHYDALTLVDADGSAPDEVLIGQDDALVLLDGATGVELARTAALGTFVQRARCTPIGVDAAPGDELVCVHDVRFDPLINQRKVFLVRYLPGPPAASLEVPWTVPLAPVVGGELDYTDLVRDLDEDGTPEVIVSAYDDSGMWSTHILDAASGAAYDVLPGEIAVGTAASDAGGLVLLTSSESHTAGWRFDSTASPTVESRWTVLDAVTRKTLDYPRAARSSIAMVATTAELDGAGTPELIMVGRIDEGLVTAYAGLTGPLTERGRYQLPAGVAAGRLWPVEGSADMRLAVVRNDGFLNLFTDGLALARGEDDASIALLRTGGFYAAGGFRQFEASPRVAGLEADQPDRVLVRNSRGDLVVLDASLASFVAPPRLGWQVDGGFAPTVVPGLDAGARPGVACLALDKPVTTPPTHSVKALTAAGTELWSIPAPADPLNDLVPGVLDGDAIPDLVLQWGRPTDVLLQTRALSGVDGSTIWDATPVNPGGGRKPPGAALGRFDGDAADDLFHQANGTQVLSGVDGAQLSMVAGPSYFMPSLVDVDADARDEVILHGGLEQIRALDDDATTALWQSAQDDSPLPYGAVATCGDGRMFLVTSALLVPARLKLIRIDPAGAGGEQLFSLAGGMMAPEGSPSLNGQILGQLTSAAVHQDLAGQAGPVAVMGSTDGWLYAVDPCGAALAFSLRFGSAVGDAAFGDTDGDGRDEILVTVGDGYLYDVRAFELPVPTEVRDVSPLVVSGADIDEVQTVTSLAATWAAVTGATGYEIAIADSAGNYVTEPPWIDVGDITSAVVDQLALVDGEQYRFSVRAIAGALRSADTPSDGVVARFPAAPDAGPGETPPDGGCCGVRGRAAPSGSALLLVAIWWAALRRRRR